MHLPHLLKREIIIIGGGLMGSTLATNLYLRYVSHKITIVESDDNNVKYLTNHFADDQLGIDVKNNLSNISKSPFMVIIAVPLSEYKNVCVELRSNNIQPKYLTDIGSVWSDDTLHQMKKVKCDNIIRMHPMVGSHLSGPENSGCFDFNRKTVYLSSHNKFINHMWTILGANVKIIDEDRHNRLVSAVSHMPHLLSFALAKFIEAHPEDTELLIEAAGGGLQSMTRLSDSSDSLWNDIFNDNHKNLRRDYDLLNEIITDYFKRVDCNIVHRNCNTSKFFENNKLHRKIIK